MILGSAHKYKNNSHCKLLLPFVNSVTENLAKGGSSHVITNHNVVIRDLSSYSIPNCPNGAANAAYFDGSTAYITIPNSEEFERTDGRPLMYSAWLYPTSFADYRYFITTYDDGNNQLTSTIILNTGKLSGQILIGGVRHYILGNNNEFVQLNQWNLIQWVYGGKINVTGSYNFINQKGDISTYVGAEHDPIFTNDLHIGRIESYSSRFFQGYMSELSIMKGYDIQSIGTYNPERDQISYSEPNRRI